PGGRPRAAGGPGRPATRRLPAGRPQLARYLPPGARPAGASGRAAVRPAVGVGRSLGTAPGSRPGRRAGRLGVSGRELDGAAAPRALAAGGRPAGGRRHAAPAVARAGLRLEAVALPAARGPRGGEKNATSGGD